MKPPKPSRTIASNLGFSASNSPGHVSEDFLGYAGKAALGWRTSTASKLAHFSNCNDEIDLKRRSKRTSVLERLPFLGMANNLNLLIYILSISIV